MKKLISLLLTTVLLLSLIPLTVLATDVAATKTASKVTVDGVVKSFDAYTINGNNYFKLRDIAYILSGTAKQFEVTWDGTKNAINLVSGKNYTVAGGEMTAATGNVTKTAILSTSKIYLDGKEIKLTAYTISGNNYFKLRDLGSAFDFGVEWDGKNNTVAIKSTAGYVPEVGTTTAYIKIPYYPTSDPQYPLNVYAGYIEIHSKESVFFPESVHEMKMTYNGKEDIIWLHDYFGSYWDIDEYQENPSKFKEDYIKNQVPDEKGEYVYSIMFNEVNYGEMIKSLPTSGNTGATCLVAKGTYEISLVFNGEKLTYHFVIN